MKLNHNQTQHLRNGGFWAAYNGLTVWFMTPFLLVLGATNTEVGFVGALPYLAILIAMVPGVKLLESFTRIQVYSVCTLIGRLSWFAVILAVLFGEKDLILIIGKIGEALSDSAYHTVLGDIAPKIARGEFFGKRLWIFAFFGIIVYLFGGFFLEWLGDGVNAFSFLFGVGAIFGLQSIREFRRIKEPEFIKDHKIRLIEFVRMSDQFKYFCVFVASFHFAYMLALPFFTVFMLKELELGYTLFVLIGAVQSITLLLSQQGLGRLTDLVGEKMLGIVSMITMICVPILYLFITVDNLWLLVLAQVISGLGLAGVGVILGNFLLDLTPEKKRAVGIAQYGIVLAAPMAVAPLLGGWMADNLIIGGFSGLRLVFITSAILLCVALFCVSRIKEPRGKKHPLRYLESMAWNKLRHIMRHGGNNGL